MKRNIQTGTRTRAIALAALGVLVLQSANATEMTAVPVTIDASCGCHGVNSQSVEQLIADHPDGGPGLAAAIASLVAATPSLAQDVVCMSHRIAAPAAEAAGEGLARTGLPVENIANISCCGADQLMVGFYNTAYASSDAVAPKCFENVAGNQLTQLLTPNFSAFGNAAGAGNAGGLGAPGGIGSVVTPAGP